MNGPMKQPTLSARPPKSPQAVPAAASGPVETDLASRLRQAQERGFLATFGDGDDVVSSAAGSHQKGQRGRKGNPKNAERTQLIIRLPPDLHDQLKFVAKNTPHHTVQALIEHLLLQGLPAELEKAERYAEIMK